MKSVAAKFVIHVLLADQKQSSMDICCQLKEHFGTNLDSF